jgi:tetratricopeptide (TPR) repeat protein
MKRDYEKNENNETNEKHKLFRLFRYFRFFRNLSSFLAMLLLFGAALAQGGEGRLREARELARKGDWKNAEERLREYLKSNPGAPEASVLHARALFHLNQPFDAALEIEALLRTSPDNVSALKFYAALLDTVIQDDAKAEAVLLTASQLAPHDLEIWQALGHHFLAVHKPGEAVRCFTKAVELAPANPSLIAGLGISFALAGDRVRAERYIARALKITVRSGKPDARVFLFAGEYLLRSGELNRIAESIPVFTKALLTDPHLTDAYYGRASAYERMKKYRLAEADALAALRESERRRDAHQLLIRIYQLQGRHEEAAKYSARLEQLVSGEQESLAAGRRLRAILVEAEPLLQAGRFADAATRYEEIVRISPSFYEGWFALGVAYSQTSREAEAETAFKKYLEMQPLSADGHAGLGVLLLAMNRATEARPVLARALQLDPSLSEARKALGRIHIAAREYAEAIREFSSVIDSDTESESDLYFLLIGAQLRTQDRAGALRTFNRGTKAHPDPAFLKDVAQVVLREDPRESVAEGILNHLRLELPNDPEARYLFAHWLFIGNEHQRCLEELTSAAGLPGNNDKTRMEIYALAGMAEQSLGALERAEAAYQRSLASNRRLPKPSPLATFKYVELLMKSARFDQAEKLITEILSWSPEFGPAHLELARLLVKKGEKEKAVESAQLALRYTGDDVDQLRAIHSLLAKTLFSLERTQEAEEHQRRIEALVQKR